MLLSSACSPGNTSRSLGWEREFGDGSSAGVDAVYAEATGLQRNTDWNRQCDGYDEYGRPMWGGRVRDGVAEILVRQSRGESEYQAVTLKVNRRFTGRYQFGTHGQRLFARDLRQLHSARPLRLARSSGNLAA